MVGQRELVQVEAANSVRRHSSCCGGHRYQVGGWSCGQGNSWNAFQAVRLRSVSQRGSSREARNASKASWRKSGWQRFRSCYPTVPSICSSIRRFISTAYSMGSSLTSGSMKPLTIIVEASASLSPRLAR